MKTKRFSIRSIILTAALSVFVTLGAAALAVWLLLGSSGLAIATGAVYINARFVGEYDEDAMADAALNAMVESLGTAGPTTWTRKTTPRRSCAGTTPTWGSG